MANVVTYVIRKKKIDLKICWDNLEKFYYSNGKYFRKDIKGKYSYIESEKVCEECNEYYLHQNTNRAVYYCSNICRNRNSLKNKKHSEETKEKIGKQHKGKIVSKETRKKLSEKFIGKTLSEKTKEKMSKAHKGRKHSEETKEKIGKQHKGKIVSEETKEKLRQYNLGRKLSEEHRKNIGISGKGRKHSEETKKRISEGNKGKHSEENSSNWKGGYNKKGITTYDTYIHKLQNIHECRRNEEDQNILEVKCTYCGKWYIPTYRAINARLDAIYNRGDGGNNLYCSKECKQECPTYYQNKFPKGFKPTTSREVQPELRKLVFERDNWLCVKCGIDKNLHCHHIDPVVNNPIESADINNCVTVCYTCHNEIHKKDGCKYNELKC
jgi:hypothetical protein